MKITRLESLRQKVAKLYGQSRCENNELGTRGNLMKQGDRVKLTDRVAAAFNKNKRPGQLDWKCRRGVIERISANKVNVLVLWEGRKTLDEVPISGIDLDTLYVDQ